MHKSIHKQNQVQNCRYPRREAKVVVSNPQEHQKSAFHQTTQKSVNYRHVHNPPAILPIVPSIPWSIPSRNERQKIVTTEAQDKVNVKGRSSGFGCS